MRFLDSRSRYVANIYGDAPTTDLETNPDEVRITRLIAPMTGGSGQAVHLEPASRSQVETLPRCGSSTPLCH